MFCSGFTGVSVRRGGRRIEMFCTGSTGVSVRWGGREGAPQGFQLEGVGGE